MLRVLTNDDARAELHAGLDEIVREGACRMLAAALEAEVDAYVTAFADERDEAGRRLVVRNGHAEARTVTTAAGGIEITAPRVNDGRVDEATGERQRFASVIVPPWCRKSPKVSEVLPLLYLHGMSSGDFVPALEEFFGTAAGLSASVITRLTKQWQGEQKAFSERPLADRDYVYIWADGIHFNVRLEEARLCALVIVGVRADGTKELVAITDGHRESTESWADLLRDLKRRGMRAPMVAVGDGALGFWAALRKVWPDTLEQRCWVHYAEDRVMPSWARNALWDQDFALMRSAQSQGLQEGEERVGRPIATWIRAGGCGAGQRPFFDGEIGVQVDLGGLDAFMAEPERDDRGVDSDGEEPHGAGVAQDVWRHGLGQQ